MAKTGNSDKEKIFSKHIINNSRSMISIINRNYVYEKVNRPFCNAHKGLSGSFIGKSLGDVWGAETFETKIKNNLDQCFCGKIIKYEATFGTPKSGERDFEVIFRPIKSDSGVVTHLMAETFDITDLRKSRKAAEELKQEFKKMEISFENRLLQAQRLETVGVLAGGIAHDFNNILATISGYTEMLQDDLNGNVDLLEKTSKILSAVNRARSLTNQILTFSRQVEQERVYVNAVDILKETVGFVRSAAPPEIKIKTRYAGVRAAVFADPTQLFRVFLNLMTNAVQSMEEKGGTLTVSAGIVDGNIVKSATKRDIVADEYVRVTFRDTGVGMAQSVIQRIFEPFYSSREVGKGTGLGLSVVHGIVSELEGEIMVTSRENHGSSFEVFLPLSKEYHGKEKGDENRKKVLFIKGNKYESRILSMALESAGYDLIFATDTRQLGKIFSGRKNTPDLVIYMIDSEKISEHDLMKYYKNFHLMIPCVLITDMDHGEQGKELIDPGIIKQHLFKPVSLKELKNAIRISLNNH